MRRSIPLAALVLLVIATSSQSAVASTVSLIVGGTQGPTKNPLVYPSLGIYQVVPPGGACNQEDAAQACWPGYLCSSVPDSVFTKCVVDDSSYPDSCSKELDPGMQCAGPSDANATASGKAGAAPGVCCPSAQVCALDALRAKNSSQWYCSDPPVIIEPTAKALIAAAVAPTLNRRRALASLLPSYSSSASSAASSSSSSLSLEPSSTAPATPASTATAADAADDNDVVHYVAQAIAANTAGEVYLPHPTRKLQQASPPKPRKIPVFILYWRRKLRSPSPARSPSRSTAPPSPRKLSPNSPIDNRSPSPPRQSPSPSANSPKKSPKRSPKKSPKRSPEKVPKRSPKKVPKRSPKKVPKRSPKKSPKRSPKKKRSPSPKPDNRRPGSGATPSTFTTNDFAGPPTDYQCYDKAWSTPPCTCYDASPSCTCSPFKAGYGTVPPPIKISGSTFVNPNGDVVTLKGMNWFGFENGFQFLDGTWGNADGSKVGGGDGRNCLGSDLSLIVYRLRLLGFNAVRLPFRFSELRKTATNHVEDGCTMPTLTQFKALNLPPSLASNPSAHPLPEPYEGWKCTMPGDAPYKTRSNIYVPGARSGADGRQAMATVGERFKWVVQYFVARGFYVMMDYHPYMWGGQNTLADDHDLYSDPPALGRAWAGLMKEFKALASWPSLKGRLIVDTANELDLINAQWDKQGVPRAWGLKPCAPYRDLADAVVAAVKAVDRNTIVSVGGVGQTADKCNNWGEGFRTGDTGGSSAESWFKGNDKDAPVALSTHVYCEYSYTCSRDELAGRFDNNWGLKSTTPVHGKVYPYIIGEVGSGWNPYQQDWPEDGAYGTSKSTRWNDTALSIAQYNQDTGFRPFEERCNAVVAEYLTGTSFTYGDRRTTQHARPAGVFWWTYNFNSAGPGGLTEFNKGVDLTREAIALKWYKIAYMEKLSGMTPWYRG